MQDEKKELGGRYDALDREYNDLNEHHRKVLEKTVIPYARSKGIGVNLQTGEPLDAILRRLLQDATRTDSSPGQNQIWQKKLQASQGEAQAASIEARVWKDKMQALSQQAQASLDQMQILRQQVQTSQNQNKALRKKMETSQGQEQALRDQVQDLQRDLLARIEKAHTMSDDQLNQDFCTLASMIKTMSRTIPFDASVDVAEALSSPGFLGDVSPQHWQGRTQKKRFIEAWTWAVLHIFIFQTPFTIFGKHGGGLGESWSNIFGRNHVLGWPCPTTSCEAWRYTTTELLVKAAGKDTITHGDAGLLVDDWEGSVLKVRKETKKIIETHLLKIAPASDEAQLTRIVDKAFTLAMNMSLQRSRLQVTYPIVGARFVAKEMVFVPDRDGDDVNEGVVAFVLNPGLTKWGNAHGEYYDRRFDIVPSLVQLEPDIIKCEPMDIKPEPESEW